MNRRQIESERRKRLADSLRIANDRYFDGKLVRPAKQEEGGACLISRVSSRRQENNISVEVQQKENESYAREAGLQVLMSRTIVESAKFATDRKKYAEAIVEAIRCGAKHIVFHMGDREARNLIDLEANEYLVRSGIVVLHYVRERKVLNDQSPESDFFVRDINGVMAKHFSQALGKRIGGVLDDKARSGWAPFPRLPLGYVHMEMPGGLKRKYVAQDPVESNVAWVRREFELRASGYSLEQIRVMCVQEGFVPAGRVAGYSVGVIENRLSNVFYRGRFFWRGSEFEGRHEIIIPQEHLRQVELRAGLSFMRKDHGSEGVLAGGWLRCKLCGCHVIFDPKKKKLRDGSVRVHPYYHCTDGKGVHRATAEKVRNISVEKIWQQFGNALDEVVVPKELADQIADALNELKAKGRDSTSRQVEYFRRVLLETERTEDALYDDFKRQLLDEEAYRRQIARVRVERSEATKTLERLQNQLTDSSIETAKSILELSMSAKTLWESRSPGERRDLLDRILSNPVLNGVTIEFEFRKPFQVLREIREKKNWMA